MIQFHLPNADKSLLREQMLKLFPVAELPRLNAPDYFPGQYGKWRLEKQVKDIGLVPGYWSGHQTVRHNFTLKRHGRIWMSITPMELESNALGAMLAHGNVVICGLGMGVVTIAALNNPSVDEVTVLERDPGVIELFKRITHLTPQQRAKLKIIRADANTWICKVKPDFLYIDIWPTLGTKQALPAAQSISQRIQPAEVYYWGQELDMALWALQDKQPTPYTVDTWNQFCRHAKLPLVGTQVNEYPKLIMRAAINASMN